MSSIPIVFSFFLSSSRRLAQDLSHPLITTLQQECSRATCPEMKAGEWLYLCVAHGNDGAMEQCCAIDYILHTVDSATALLNSPRTFPSRQVILAVQLHFLANQPTNSVCKSPKPLIAILLRSHVGLDASSHMRITPTERFSSKLKQSHPFMLVSSPSPRNLISSLPNS